MENKTNDSRLMNAGEYKANRKVFRERFFHEGGVIRIKPKGPLGQGGTSKVIVVVDFEGEEQTILFDSALLMDAYWNPLIHAIDEFFHKMIIKQHYG